ncbi:hypothetical protein A5790_11140 [Mycobacterium sp. 852002-51152_SCH6134967]|uniref:hypothetical protein n=1 Tax=Mycobacterium sp. 852002-51152_SCH6134967 TaxID=1834096 RepID=UPI0008010543|nr:hypothetical protein [Mycobacterium sp. 852002-51152_SCH6134967]OBF93349.1 hypothetical protein A5790_11140 [Mycobacterium sp. 852002-51152_SCH6134967]
MQERLCADAGLNKRYFYESFTEVDAVAGAVIDDIAAAVRDATVGAAVQTQTKPVEQQAFACVTALVHSLVDGPRRARVLLGGVAATPGLRTHRVAVMRSLTDVLIEHARTVHGVELARDRWRRSRRHFWSEAPPMLFWPSSTAPRRSPSTS